MPDKQNTKDEKEEASSPSEEVRIGVYTCYCGGNISDVVDCEQVARGLSKIPNVVVSRTDMSMCSNAGQAMVEEDIREYGVNRVVIGACAPSLHEQTFRNTVARAGLNPYFYLHVGLREQVSWAHNSRQAATEKSIRLMTAGIAKARLLEPLEPIVLKAEQHALVIGGGVAGLRSALDISRLGLKVTLVERSPFLGGRTAQLESVFPTGENARDLLHPLIEKVLNDPNITVYTYAEVTHVSGCLGDYHIQITQQSRGVSEEIAEAAMAACKVEVPDEYNYRLTKRKAIYRAYPGCYPSSPAVDWVHCQDGCLEMELNGKTITLENKPKTVDITVGAIVVATGFKPYEPRHGEYGYGEFPEVMTLPQFIRWLALNAESRELRFNEHPIRNIALIHCVGSRQIEGLHEPQPDDNVNDYCSRFCCTATLHLANELKERQPDIHIFDIYEDIRTYGRGHEDYYTQASENRVLFLRFHGEEPPQVMAASEDDPSPLLVKLRDYLTWGDVVEVPADMVVLSVGMMPSPINDLIDLLKISQGTDRFLLEVHPKLRPVETAVPGVVLAGTAQGPMNIQESCAAAGAAAAKVGALLSKGSVELEPFVVKVNHELCTGSGECVTVCTYEEALKLETFTIEGKQVQRAVVTPANCAGCGLCVSACPNHALELQGWTVNQFRAQIEAILADIPSVEVEA
jgi:heterodisulfide reductase subunit A